MADDDWGSADADDTADDWGADYDDDAGFDALDAATETETDTITATADADADAGEDVKMADSPPHPGEDDDDDGFFDGDDDDEDDDFWEGGGGGGGADDWGDADEDGHKAKGFGEGPTSDFAIRHDIPEVTFEAITNNCVEVNMIPLFAAVPDLKSRLRIGAVLGLRIDRLSNITDEQLEVWNITPEFKYIAVRMVFDPFYLNEAKLPRIEVGMTRSLSVTEKMVCFCLFVFSESIIFKYVC